jgi:xanthine dehydrogenase YagR molybdenum-binding subunit
MPRKEKVRVGFPGTSREIEVEVQDGDQSPWELGDEFRVVGTPVPRLDGADKVTGRAKYAYDVNPKGLCHAVVLRSPHPAATVKSIDLSAAEAVKGVVAALSVPAGSSVNFAGQEVAAVAAETEDIARDALAKIRVEYATRPFVVDVEAARAEGAPSVFPDGRSNVNEGRGVNRHGDKLEEALAESDAVVSEIYRTQVQTHTCLETHGCVAQFEKDGTLTVWASTQATNGWQRALERRYELSGKVRVLTHHMGGGFGSKFGPRLVELWCVDLAKKADRPVKLMCDRKGEHLATGNRPNSVQSFRGGAKKDGTLTALEIHTFGTGGTAGGARCANPVFYDFPVVVKTEADVHTNAGPACAMRAPGYPQGVYAMDSFMDELAAAIEMDPLEFRKKNDRDPIRQAEYDIGAKEIGWDRRQPDGAGEGPIVRGLGMANATWHQAGGGSWQVETRVSPEGVVEIRNAVQDIGTGTRTILAIAAAEELGVAAEEVRVFIGDTTFAAGPGSGGSTTAPSMFPAARNSAANARAALFEAIAPKLGVAADQLALTGDGRIAAGPGEPGKVLTFREACALLPEAGIVATGRRFPNYDGFQNSVAGTQFVEVEVDRETGVVRVLKVVAVQDCGKVIDKLTAESQVIGAVIGGIGYALFEDRILDPNEGRMVNPDLLFYKIPGAAEMPEIVPILFDVAQGKNNAGVMGLGEPPAIPTAAAIANAVANATGARVREIPITPDRLLAAIDAAGRGG